MNDLLSKNLEKKDKSGSIMNSDLVSVIIPTYNRAGLIKNAVDSVINQTYKNLEILIVDDGSKDNTEEVIKSINDPRIVYIYQENAGPSAARNTGIRNAKGKYVAFLDSDDFWLPRKIEKQVKIAKSNPNIGMVSCSFGCFDIKTNASTKVIFKIENNREYLQNLVLMHNSPKCPSFMLIKRECFDKAGMFDEKMNALEDWDLWFRICLKYDFYCTDEILVHYNSSEDSLSNTTLSEENETCYLRYLEKIYENNALPESILKVKNKAYSNAFWSLAWNALYRSKDKNVAKKYMFKSLKYNYKKMLNPGFLIALVLLHISDKALNIYSKSKTGL